MGTTGSSPQTDRKAPLLKTAPIQLTEYKDVEWVPTKSLIPCILMSFVEESTLKQKRNLNTNPATCPLTYNIVLPERYASVMVALSL